MNPVLGIVAGYPIHVFAVLLDLGVAAGLVLTVWLAARRGVAPSEMLEAVMWVLPAGLVGARLLYVVAHWSEYAPNPITVVSVWEGGLSLLGAITAGLGAAWVVLGARRLPRGTYLDAAAPGVALGQAIGRLGCLVAGCATGVQVDPHAGLPWLELPDPTGLVAARFPSQLVETGGELLLCAVLLLVWWRRPRPGTVAAAYLIGYGLLRLAAEPLRGDSTAWGPLALASWWSAAAVAAGAAALVVRRFSHGDKHAAGTPSAPVFSPRP